MTYMIKLNQLHIYSVQSSFTFLQIKSHLVVLSDVIH